MSATPDRVRLAWGLLEPLHAVTYFAPEPVAALAEAGYRGFWMGYFAGRAAPLGAASAEVVDALFYNFAPERVRRAVPAAWGFAPPEAALAARSAGSVAALRRAIGAEAGRDVERAADLAERAALAAPVPGRALFAANLALPVPTEPLARLWHAATLLREHRGDGHVASLLAHGVGGRESHVLHALACDTPAAVYEAARDMGPEEWDSLRAGLVARGLADDAGLTDEGRALCRALEDDTDRAALTAYDVLSDGELDELLGLLRPLAAAVVRAGDIPLHSPVGLDLSTLL